MKPLIVSIWVNNSPVGRTNKHTLWGKISFIQTKLIFFIQRYCVPYILQISGVFHQIHQQTLNILIWMIFHWVKVSSIIWTNLRPYIQNSSVINLLKIHTMVPFFFKVVNPFSLFGWEMYFKLIFHDSFYGKFYIYGMAWLFEECHGKKTNTIILI